MCLNNIEKMEKLVFATNNQHKLREIREILKDKFEVLSLDDINCKEEIEETAETLDGNALIKAEYIKEKYGFDCFADDTGLEVYALDNAPGVYSARYAGEDKDAKANMNKLLTELNGKDNRDARFRTVIALIIGNEKYLFEGIVEGQITESESGSEGFGYDPVFMPKGYDITFAEMDSSEKNAISHRGRAMASMIEFLKNID